MFNDKVYEFIEKLLKSFFNRYQNNLKKLMKGNEFVINYIYLLRYKCHKINPNCAGSYIDAPDWIKNKKVTINSFSNKEFKSFQYAVTVALNYEGMRKHSETMTKIKPSTNKNNWKVISFPIIKRQLENKLSKTI